MSLEQNVFENKGKLFRDNIRKGLNKFVDNETISTNLEIGVYKYAYKEARQKKILKKWDNKKFLQIYIDRLRSIYINLKNVDLLNNIKSGEITPQSIAFMTHQEMNPNRWKILIENKMKRDENKYNTNLEASTDMFTCKKCKSKRCTYYELQTRSADEPSTIFVTCLDCGKNMKH
jgi:transcription elongation factor S-II